MDELTEVREREQQQRQKQRQAEDKKVVIAKLKLSFTDATEDLFEELFGKEIEPEHVGFLQCYPQLREVFRDSLAEDIKNLKSGMDDKNDGRLKKLHAFEKAVSIAEKESEAEAFQMVRYFRSYMKKGLVKIEKDDVSGRREVEVAETLKQLNEHLLGLENQLMANEVQLQESIEEAVSDFQAKVEDIMKIMQDLGSEFFKRLEEHHRTFFSGLSEGANTETEAFQQSQDTSLAETDTQKAKFLGQREDMTAAIANFSEAQGSLVQNKEDVMMNAMSGWRDHFFESHRNQQYHRNRQRILDTKKVIDDCREEIAAAGELAEYDDEHGE